MNEYYFFGDEVASIYEAKQIHTALETVKTWALKSKQPFVAFLRNFNYSHPGLGRPWNSIKWDGEIDLLIIMRNHFIIMEFKSKKAIVFGRTQLGNWQVQYDDINSPIEEKDYFTQCSKEKAFFSQEYYPKRFVQKIDRHKLSKLRPDVLLVFKDGSDLSNIWYVPPVRFDKNDFEMILKSVSRQAKDFLDKRFYYNPQRNVYMNKEKQDDVFLKQLEKALNEVNYENRVKKWFKVITESELFNLIENLGGTSFNFSEEDLVYFENDFKLKEM